MHQGGIRLYCLISAQYRRSFSSNHLDFLVAQFTSELKCQVEESYLSMSDVKSFWKNVSNKIQC